ncbi:MAG: hypothetical protein AAF657_27305 [Acidobacteriota bacterium]
MLHPRKATAWLALLALVCLTVPQTAAAQAPEAVVKAPTKLYPKPAVYLLLRLPGDTVTVRYTPGSLDRAANLQNRLELANRAFKRWVGVKLEIDVYLLSRDEWRQARYDVPYGVPVRVDRRGLAAPAEGDDGTVALWSEMLQGALPAVAGAPIRGTPQQTATMILADFITQLQICEILVDEIEIAGDRQWVRGLTTHLASVDLVRRLEAGRLRDLDTMYQLLARDAGPRAFSARDYGPELSLHDWLWYQAQFHAGAQVLLAKIGKGAVKKMRQLRKKSGGVLSGDLLLRRYKGLDQWYYDHFTAVSLRH